MPKDKFIVTEETVKAILEEFFTTNRTSILIQKVNEVASSKGHHFYPYVDKNKLNQTFRVILIGDR